MNETNEPRCQECEDPTLDRRGFIRVVSTAAVAATAGVPAIARARRADQPAKPAEALILELFSSLDEQQKKSVLLPFDHGPKTAPTRLGMYNAALPAAPNTAIGKVYTKAQQELLDKIVRAMVAGEDGYRLISRLGTWDASKSFDNCGAHFFGSPGKDAKYAWLFTGHHMTIRADGDFMDGAAWGGPMYYGHSPNGYVPANCFNFQTKQVLELAKALDEKQMKKAVIEGTPGEGAGSVKLRKPGEAKPGLSVTDMSKDQLALIEKVMRELMSPYRKEDGDEVMKIIKTRGGLEKLHLAFYRDKGANENERWHFWRLEGPGFIWNYRVLPHVHCFVNIGNEPTA
jgi:hypothetical protein